MSLGGCILNFDVFCRVIFKKFFERLFRLEERRKEIFCYVDKFLLYVM